MNILTSIEVAGVCVCVYRVRVNAHLPLRGNARYRNPGHTAEILSFNNKPEGEAPFGSGEFGVPLCVTEPICSLQQHNLDGSLSTGVRGVLRSQAFYQLSSRLLPEME